MNTRTEKLLQETLEEIRDLAHATRELVEDLRTLLEREIKTTMPARDRG